MRRGFLAWVLLPWCVTGALAFPGNKNQKSDDPQDDTPSWAAQDDPNQPDDPCSTVPPPMHLVEVAWASAKNEADAKALAIDKARTALQERACAGQPELNCAAITQRISPWGGGQWDKRAKSACHAVAVPKNLLTKFESQIDRLDDQFADLANSIVERNDGNLLQIMPPSWASGCVAGELGAAFASRLRNSIAEAGPQPLVPQGKVNPKANQLQIRMAPSGSAVTVTANLANPEADSVIPLPGFNFQHEVFNVDRGEVGRCRGSASLGIEGWERAGVGDLHVFVDAPSRDGMFCEGESFEPVVRVSQPAKVKVYSVAQDGTALLIWPPPGHPGTVDAEVNLGESTLVSLEEMGDEMLVATAVPASDSFGTTDNWTGFCRLDTPFGPTTVPKSAAVGMATYMVVPSGLRGCAPVDSSTRDTIRSILRGAPLCSVANQ